MQRASRAAAGGVVIFVLVLVAAVSGLVVLVGSSQLRERETAFVEPFDGGMFVDPVTVQAEVLDVDGQSSGVGGWLSVDVVFETPAGGTEVVAVDLGERTADSTAPPQVGDVIDIVVERDDPGYALRADDPMLSGEGVHGDADGAVDAERERAAAEALVRRSGVLAVSALGLALVVGLVTAVAVVRSPVQERPGWAQALSQQAAPHRPSPGGWAP